MRAIAVALELEDAVDEVLEHARACDRSVLGDMADEDRRDSRLLRHAQEPAGGLAHLRDGARRGSELRGVERLDRVDDAHVGPRRLERRADRRELRLGEDLDRLRAAESRRAEADLRRRLLAGDEEDAPRLAHGRERREEERRFPDAGLASDEDERRRDEPAAEHAIQLRNTRRDPRRLDRCHLSERNRGCGTCPCGGRVALELLEQRAEGAATRGSGRASDRWSCRTRCRRTGR